MPTLEFLLVFVVLLAAAAVVAAPLRRRAGAGAEDDGGPDTAALEAAKEAKYREIRDAELDYRTGKLSEDDWRSLDATLREEAMVILRRLDAVRDGRVAR